MAVMDGKFATWCCWMACLFFVITDSSMGMTLSTPRSQVAIRHRRQAIVPLWSPNCGDNLCVCQGERADCSKRSFKPRIPYLPKLPPSINKVEFGGNGIPSQTIDEGFLTNVSNIRILDLRDNNVSVIHPSAFKKMRRLEELNVCWNHNLTVSSLRTVLSIPSLRNLLFAECSLGQLPPGVFQGVLSNVEQLWLDKNSLKIFNMTDFSVLSHLVQLDLSSSEINTIIPDRLSKLRKLLLTDNILTQFPVSCKCGRSVFPRLERLDLGRNHIRAVAPDVCLPELFYLDMSRNAFDILEKDSFSVTKFPKLSVLIFSSQQIFYPVQDYAFNNTNLIALSFTNNGINFASEIDLVHSNAFVNCIRLELLILDRNNFESVGDDRFHELFGHLSLKNLSIKHSQFSYITTRTFAVFSLLRELFLSGNKIPTIPEGAFDALTNLQVLDLSANRIATVHQDSLSEDIRMQLVAFSLNGNPFLCSCELLWFQSWLNSCHSIFYTHSNQPRRYMCANIADTSVADFSMAEQACLLSAAMSVQVILTCSLLIVFLTSFSLVFRYRWHIRLLLYEAFRGRDDVRRQLLETGNFRYDVFVSYASEQLPWVRQHLLPELEERLQLKVCDHERDFIPGKNILDNIADCVDSSKKMVMVFSRDFVHSEWCQFELAVCLCHAMDHEDSPIIVCVDDVAKRDMTSAMMTVLKFTTYIQWDEAAYAVESFWGRLHLALNDLLQHRDGRL